MFVHRNTDDSLHKTSNRRLLGPAVRDFIPHSGRWALGLSGHRNPSASGVKRRIYAVVASGD